MGHKKDKHGKGNSSDGKTGGAKKDKKLLKKLEQQCCNPKKRSCKNCPLKGL